MRDERGSGLVGVLGGAAVFGVLLMLAANVLLHLYAASTVGAVAFDTARRVAGAGGAGPGSRAAAVATARDLLPASGATFDWSGTTDEVVRLSVDVPGPHLLPAGVLQTMGLDRVRRSAVVRVEQFREEP